MKAKLYKKASDTKETCTVTPKDMPNWDVETFIKQVKNVCMPGTCFTFGKLEVSFKGIVSIYINPTGFANDWQSVTIK